MRLAHRGVAVSAWDEQSAPMATRAQVVRKFALDLPGNLALGVTIQALEHRESRARVRGCYRSHAPAYNWDVQLRYVRHRISKHYKDR